LVGLPFLENERSAADRPSAELALPHGKGCRVLTGAKRFLAQPVFVQQVLGQ
jgi:hypothetical protein